MIFGAMHLLLHLLMLLIPLCGMQQQQQQQHAAGNQSCSGSAAANGVITQHQQQLHSETVAERSSREMGEWVNGWMPSHCSLTPATLLLSFFPPLRLPIPSHSRSWQSEWAAGAIVVASRGYCCCGYVYCALAVRSMRDLCCSLTRVGGIFESW